MTIADHWIADTIQGEETSSPMPARPAFTSVQPAVTAARPIASKRIKRNVRTRDWSLVFHQDRVSFNSYTRLSAMRRLSTPADADQRVTNAPIVSLPPELLSIISSIVV